MLDNIDYRSNTGPFAVPLQPPFPDELVSVHSGMVQPHPQPHLRARSASLASVSPLLNRWYRRLLLALPLPASWRHRHLHAYSPLSPLHADERAMRPLSHGHNHSHNHSSFHHQHHHHPRTLSASEQAAAAEADMQALLKKV